MFKIVTCPLGPMETEVQNGLAVTPVDMERMTLTGKSIAQHQLDNFSYSDGYYSPSDLPLPERRGRDLNDNWEMVQQFKRKVHTARNRKALEAANAAVAAGEKGVDNGSV